MAYKSIVSLSCLLFAGFLLADEVTKRTEVTVNEPLLVAGVPQVTLQPGKYVFKLMRHDYNKNVVQIYNERQDHLYTTVLAINNYRLFPKEKTTFSFWETPEGNPVALRAWFPSGERWGQEFVYPKGLAAKIAKDTGSKVFATPAQTATELAQAPVTELTPKGVEEPIEEAYTAAPPPEPVQIAQAPAPVKAEPVPEPPVQTASPIYAIGAFGILAMAAGFGLRIIFRGNPS